MTFLYNQEFPQGKVFNDDEVEGLLKKGWVDNPSKIEEKAKRTRKAQNDSETDN